MLAELNRIKNADFSQGKHKPRMWKWTSSGDDVDWQAVPTSSNGALRGVQLTCGDIEGGGFWSQKFRCKRDQFYRIEAVVSCECQCEDPEGGMVLQLVPFDDAGNALEPFAFAPLRIAHEFTQRGYFKADKPIASVELQIGLRNATGTAAVHDVRAIPIIEPEGRSHATALPPPPFAHDPPKLAKTVSVVTQHKDRPLVELLKLRLGADRVTTTPAKRLPANTLAADAVFLLDDKPPAKVSSMRALNALAKDRIVFVSLLCMEAISDEHMLTRRLKQIDDPFHARVVHSNYTTAAFALYDQIPFGGRSDHSSQMFQRQFRQNPVFREFCKKHEFDVLLDSVTDSETTSEKPVALFKRTAGGAIIVMDIDPAEAVESSLHEATPVMNLILAALGIRQQTLGQYTAIGRTQEEFHSHLCDLVERYPALSWPQERRPVDCDQPALITVGRDLNTIGLPVVLRPAIMIRSILNGADTDCAYGVLLWFKSLLRPAPFVSPYAHTLNRRFRVAWLPHAARMQRWGGWSGNSDATRHEIEAEFEPKSLAAWIDVTTSSSHEVKITTANSKAMHERLASALPTLMEQIIGGRHFYQSPESASNNARSPRWQIDHKKIVVVSDRSAFADSIHASAAASGAALIKIEIPATHTAPFADSIWRTDYTALLLEHIVGLMMGMVVVNRDAAPLKFRWPEALAHLQKGAVLRKFNQPDVDLPLPKSRGKHIDLPAGTAVVAVM